MQLPGAPKNLTYQQLCDDIAQAVVDSPIHTPVNGKRYSLSTYIATFDLRIWTLSAEAPSDSGPPRRGLREGARRRRGAGLAVLRADVPHGVTGQEWIDVAIATLLGLVLVAGTRNARKPKASG